MKIMSSIICFIFGAIGVLTIGVSMKIIGEFFEEGTSATYIQIGNRLRAVANRLGAEKEYAPRHAYVRVKGEDENEND